MTQSDLISSFGRRHGRSLTPYKKRLVEELLPQLTLSCHSRAGENPDKGEVELDSRLHGNDKEIRLEIGFGAGEHLAAQAKAYPECLFIGCEPYINGVAKLLAQIDREKITNIRLFTDDARLLLETFPDASIAVIYILFPDPWPKSRHHKRRIISAETLSMLARVQPVGARLLLATDHVDYSAWMLEQILSHPDYEWTAQCKADWENPPPEWVETRYQRKTTGQGRPPVFIECRRV